ncbi:hypothetical protein Nepgr_009516 [Nepenthes gracilis]|uniref:Alpha/beta hydrolase fold-3 domain-containing protein n=1 Tax=Nepenthes gracilis TaxID=150966 RepID=A0AAD3SB11_NEPGR|nr:hypothetical protein Nepgr_009516 [Nepenthes gracilis]
MAIEPRPSLGLPWKIKLQFAMLGYVIDKCLRRDGTLNRRLFDFFDRKVPAKSTPQNGVKTHDVSVDPSRNLWFRLFIPTQIPRDDVSLPVIVYFHGGGFCILSPASLYFDVFCRLLARKLNAVVVSLNYRLAPEHKFPAQYNDGFDALKFIDENHRCLDFWPKNADLNSCFLAGDSAGGNITHHLGVRASQAEFKEARIIGLVLIQPYFGGKDRTESELRLDWAPASTMARSDWMWRAFLPNGLDRDHGAVNISGPNGEDISGLDIPPAILFVGGFDPLRDWQLRYHEWLEMSGKNVRLVDIPTACHGFYLFSEIPETAVFLSEVADFIEKQSSKIRKP